MPLRDAAREMNVPVEELAELVKRGYVEHLEGSGTIYVRPAVVSTVLVHDDDASN
jgi:hypothetical protein